MKYKLKKGVLFRCPNCSGLKPNVLNVNKDTRIETWRCRYCNLDFKVNTEDPDCYVVEMDIER